MGHLRPGVTRARCRRARPRHCRGSSSAMADVDAIVQQLRVVPFWRSPFGAPDVLAAGGGGAERDGRPAPRPSSAPTSPAWSWPAACRDAARSSLRLALGASRSRDRAPAASSSTSCSRCRERWPASPWSRWSSPRCLDVDGVGESDCGCSSTCRWTGWSWRSRWLAACASALAFGLLPALNGAARRPALGDQRADLSPRGPGAATRAHGAGRRHRWRSRCCCWSAPGWSSRSLDATRRADLGFDGLGRRHRCASTSPPASTTRCAAGRCSPRLLDRGPRPTPGIESATLARSTPLTFVDTRCPTGGDRRPRVRAVGEDLAFLSNVVAPEYFRTLTDSDSSPAASSRAGTTRRRRRSRSSTRRWRAGSGPGPSAAIGQRLRVGTDGMARTVIGVARDVKYSRVTEGAAARTSTCRCSSPTSRAWCSTSAGRPARPRRIDRVRAHLQALDPDAAAARRPNAGELTSRERFVFLEVTWRPWCCSSLASAGMALAGMGTLRPGVLHGPAEHAGDRGANGARRAGRPSCLARSSGSGLWPSARLGVGRSAASPRWRRAAAPRQRALRRQTATDSRRRSRGALAVVARRRRRSPRSCPSVGAPPSRPEGSAA